MRWLFRPDYRSFYLLNATQFLGALNDNIFKLLVIYLLINVKGAAAAPAILSLAGAIFVIPFLLFSSGAGVLADRISKRTIVVITKVLELVIMLYGVFAVYSKWDFGAYAALFLMATQSALFGPSKYGIIPELVEAKMVSKANGSLTSFTYLAIILGTFLASFITDVTDKNFVFEACFCVLIAVIGLLTSIGIKKTEPQRSKKRINPLFLYEIYQTLKASWSVPHLITAIFGSSFFLFIGAFTQLNIIPFAMQSLHLSEVGGGYLFLATAVGIAIGAILAGQLSKDRVEPGISCISGIFISLFFFTLSFFSTSLICTIISLALLGVFGGGFLIPFDSFIQVNSPDEKRGQIIAVSNFFSFVGVLCAALVLYFFSEKLGLRASLGFALMGLLSLIADIAIVGRLSSFFLPFSAQKILKRFRTLQIASPIPNGSELLIFEGNSWWDMLLFYCYFPKLRILLPNQSLRYFPWVNGWFDSFHILPPDPDELEKDIGKWTKRFRETNDPICLFIHNKRSKQKTADLYKRALNRLHFHLVFVHGVKERISVRHFFLRFNRTQTTVTFSRSS